MHTRVKYAVGVTESSIKHAISAYPDAASFRRRLQTFIMTVQSHSASGVQFKHPRSPGTGHDLVEQPRSPLHKKIRTHGQAARDSNDLPTGLLREHSDDGDEVRELDDEKPSALEAALPHVKIDEEAIEEYEASQGEKRAQQEGQSAADRLNSRKWTRGKSSIYVDAFDLALDTVLDEESSLFNDSELELFRHWRELDYEAKYL